jgi:hypothetical protein
MTIKGGGGNTSSEAKLNILKDADKKCRELSFKKIETMVAH